MEYTAEDLRRINDNSLYRTLGIEVLEAAGGNVRSRLTPAREVCWPFPGQPHGGVLFTLMDTSLAWCVLTHVDPGHNCATIHLDISYTARASGPWFICTAKVAHRTRGLSFVRGEIRDQNDRLVAQAQGTFRVIKSDVVL